MTGRCVTEKASPQFTTVVRERRSVTRPELDVECIVREFTDAIRDLDRLTRVRHWEMSFVANLDTEGRMNQFEFLVPATLTTAAQQAFAARLHSCKARQPALVRGRPVAIRHHVHLRWMGTR